MSRRIPSTHALRWLASRWVWGLAGAGSGATSVAILMAWGRVFPTSGMGSELQALVPGMVFGLVVGTLGHVARPLGEWRVAFFCVVSTVAHHLAVRLAPGFKAASTLILAGMAAGALGAFLLGAASVLVFPGRAWPWHVVAFTAAGAAFGVLLDPALRVQGGHEWGLAILYVPWQAAVALVASFRLVSPPSHPPSSRGPFKGPAQE